MEDTLSGECEIYTRNGNLRTPESTSTEYFHARIIIFVLFIRGGTAERRHENCAFSETRKNNWTLALITTSAFDETPSV